MYDQKTSNWSDLTVPSETMDLTLADLQFSPTPAFLSQQNFNYKW